MENKKKKRGTNRMFSTRKDNRCFVDVTKHLKPYCVTGQGGIETSCSSINCGHKKR